MQLPLSSKKLGASISFFHPDMKIEELFDEYIKTRPRITVDSRDVRKGDWFFALRGAKDDGHLHIEQARDSGAEKVIAHAGPHANVDDTLAALQEMARLFLKKSSAKVIAVTGSVGKTTTKELIYALFKTRFKTGKTEGNQNSQIGFPLSILNEIRGDEEYLVLEMGMTEKGNIEKLVSIAPPDIYLVTMIAPVHIMNFDGLNGIAEAKAEIFSRPRTKVGLLSKKCLPFKDILEKRGAEIHYYGENEGYPTPNIPRQHFENFYGACKVFELCGGKRGEIITDFPQHDRRFQKVEKKGVYFINDAYNASEIAIVAALKELPPAPKKFAILGEMLELGGLSVPAHENVGKVTLETVDEVILVGKGTAPIRKLREDKGLKTPLFEDYKGALGYLREQIKEGDLVYLKGSKPWMLWKVVEEF